MNSSDPRTTHNKRLKYLLVMPRLVEQVGEGYMFPLGIIYISACLKAAGFQVYCVNLNHQIGEVSEILRKIIVENDIDVIGIGGLSPQYHLIKNILQIAKKIKPKIITITGGGIITSQPEVAMTALEFSDYGVIGEGEVTICEWATALENGSDRMQVDGLVIKKDQGFVLTNTRKGMVDLDQLPWGDYEGFDLDKYLNSNSPSTAGINSSRVLIMVAARSCPYKCTFCYQSLGPKYRKRSLDHFFGELDSLLSRHLIDYLVLNDDLFFPKRADALAFAQRIKPYKLKWWANFSLNNIQEDLIYILKDSGLDSMSFGLESMDDTVLRSMRKGGITASKIAAGVKMVHDAGLPILGAFIFGDVAETLETAANTMRWWRTHPEYRIHLTLIKPFPGSAIYEHAVHNGIIKDPVQYLKEGCPQVNISKMTTEEFGKLAREIADASESMSKINDPELLSFDSVLGRASISGVCPVCATRNTWEDVKLFTMHNYRTCKNCIQNFHIQLPMVLQKNLEKNLAILLDKHQKIALWGMTQAATDLFKYQLFFSRPEIFAIDISSSKQGMDLYGKIIHDPGIIDREGIPVVIITVPPWLSQIVSQVRANHTCVVKIFDVCELLGDASTFSCLR